jgi:hypothetical protein
MTAGRMDGAMRDGIVFSVRSEDRLLGAPGPRLVRNSGIERAAELSSQTSGIMLSPARR